MIDWKTVFVAAVAPALALACSLSERPAGLEALESGRPIAALADAGTDTAAPSRPVLSALKVTLVANGCDGAGAACPQLDSLQLEVATADAVTPVEHLRYVAAFGETAQDAAAADFSHLFKADPQSATTLSAWLGLRRARSGRGFERARLCFAIAAVDEAANVSQRSDALCTDTTDPLAAGTTVVQGTPCSPIGWGCSSAGGAGMLVALAALVGRRRRACSRRSNGKRRRGAMKGG